MTSSSETAPIWNPPSRDMVREGSLGHFYWEARDLVEAGKVTVEAAVLSRRLEIPLLSILQLIEDGNPENSMVHNITSDLRDRYEAHQLPETS